MVVGPAAGHRLVGMGLGTLIDVDLTDPSLVVGSDLSTLAKLGTVGSLCERHRS